MDQRTVHTLVHVWEPLGSPYNASHLLCLSRTKIDTTAPVPPESAAAFRCPADVCPAASAVPLASRVFSLAYAPSTSQLQLDLSSCGETAGGGEFRTVRSA